MLKELNSKMKILAIIPARGGSKRLPRKNILDLGGKPLIAWTIEAALKSSFITDVIVSTDDLEIAAVSEKYGAEVPFLRPLDLSNDTASSIDVVKHSISYMKEFKGKEYDFILLLQPTSPLRSINDIDYAVEEMIEKKADSIISMCECEHPPVWSNTLPDDLSIVNFDRKEYLNVRSQDIPIYYRYNGAIYISRVKRLIDESSFYFNTNSFAYIMPQERSIDIDSQLDFKIAELLIGINYE